MFMMRIGLGYDLHRLVENRKLILGGINIPFEKGEDGHSDGDVLLHAITDAYLYICTEVFALHSEVLYIFYVIYCRAERSGYTE